MKDDAQQMDPRLTKLENGCLSISGDTILCPQCVHDCSTSTVYTSCGFVTHAGVSRYHDSKGRYHIHDPNQMSNDWSCSLGHGGSAAKTRYVGPVPKNVKYDANWNLSRQNGYANMATQDSYLG